MNKYWKIGIITITIVCIVGIVLLLPEVPPKRTIHVVISPVDNYNDGGWAIFYDDYFNPPTSYWKKGIKISSDNDTIIREAISLANFVSTPVVIVAHRDFQEALMQSNVTNAEGQEVSFQWYG